MTLFRLLSVLARHAWLPCLAFLVHPALAAPVGAAATDGMFAELHTSRGVISARLHFERAPLTVMNFVGLAEGTIAWADPKSGATRKEPLYRNLVFHMVRDFMIQTGDPTGTGTGGSGQTFADEIDPQLSHARAGMLVMANRGPGTNSSQFFITRKPAPWLEGHHTIFGEVVSGLDVANRVVQGDKLVKVAIVRRGEAAVGFNAARAHELANARTTRLKEAARKVLPGRIGPADPARVPAPDQPLVSPGDFDFLVIGHTELRDLERIGQAFYYDHAGALEVARKLAQIARAKGQDFNQLIERYSDMRRDTVTRGVADSPQQPAGLKAIFRLKAGQVSDPIDLPTGVYIFRRLPPQATAPGGR
ncbi:MAG: peptidylprolyl isomerase [Betaproteobacteria bacterium]|nr:peptidylprolyl isomerase [Betaproteobacteria bacterium]